jgi:hypothetical protein
LLRHLLFSCRHSKSDLEEYKKETCLRGACFAYVRNDGGEQQSNREQESSGKSSEESGEDAASKMAAAALDVEEENEDPLLAANYGNVSRVCRARRFHGGNGWQ